MYLAASVLFFLTCSAMAHYVSSEITQDDLQSVTFEQHRTNNSLDLEALLQHSRAKEAELERVQKVNRNFEKMLQLVNILGQVDSFLSERTKLLLRKLAMLADDDVDGYYRRRRS